jgi:hypothetical protein
LSWNKSQRQRSIVEPLRGDVKPAGEIGWIDSKNK